MLYLHGLVLSIVVHYPNALPKVCRSATCPCRTYQEEPILPDVPYHASNNGDTVVRDILSGCEILSAHESHGALSAAGPDRQRADICVQESDDQKDLWALD